eukprot:5020988-Pyramimonas_sp.AAC.1
MSFALSKHLPSRHPVGPGARTTRLAAMAAPRANGLGPRTLHLQRQRRLLTMLVFLKETEATMH